MATYEVQHSTQQRRPQRLWLVETLIVLGVLAFGYFAITMDSSLFTGQPVNQQPMSPIEELLR